MNDHLKLAKGAYSGNICQMKEYQSFIGSETTYQGDFNQSFHYHENPHISLVVRGGNFEAKKSGSELRNSGEVLFYYSGELHKTMPAIPSTKNLNIELDQQFLTQHAVTEEMIAKAVKRDAFSCLTMLKIQAELYLDDSVTESSIQSTVLEFVHHQSTKHYDTIQWCNVLKELLNDEWDVNHTLSALSNRLNIHPVTISKHFPKYFGCTLGDYTRKLKIKRSLELINKPEYTLTEIAFLCGFADQSHFLRVFKLYTGMNPKYFRNL